MIQMVEGMDPGKSFSMYGNAKGKNGLLGLHNQHRTLFQCIVCVESDKIWVFTNMQTILWSILWPVYDIHVCHTFVWTVYDIHATIRHHI